MTKKQREQELRTDDFRAVVRGTMTFEAYALKWLQQPKTIDDIDPEGKFRQLMGGRSDGG